MKFKKLFLSLFACAFVSSALLGCGNKKTTYSLEFNKNAEEGVVTGFMEGIDVEPGTSMYLPHCTFESSFYSFEGWSTRKNATTAQYADGARFTMPDHDVRLYAIWHASSIAIHFDLNGGQGTMQDIIVDYKGGLYLPDVPSGSKPNPYTGFKGWALSPEGDDTIYGANEYYGQVTEELTFYARWQGEAATVQIIMPQCGGTSTSISMHVGDDVIKYIRNNSFWVTVISQYFLQVDGFRTSWDYETDGWRPEVQYYGDDELILTDTFMNLYVFGDVVTVPVTYHFLDQELQLNEPYGTSLQVYNFQQDRPYNLEFRRYLEQDMSFSEKEVLCSEYYVSVNGGDFENTSYVYFNKDSSYEVYVRAYNSDLRFYSRFNGQMIGDHGDDNSAQKCYFGATLNIDDGVDSLPAIFGWILENYGQGYSSFTFETLDKDGNVIASNLRTLTITRDINVIVVDMVS